MANSTKTQIQTTVDAEIGTLSGILATVSPFYKAIAAAVTGILIALVNFAISGSFDAVSITASSSALLTALVVYEVRNKTAVPAAPAATPAPLATGAGTSSLGAGK